MAINVPSNIDPAQVAAAKADAEKIITDAKAVEADVKAKDVAKACDDIEVAIDDGKKFFLTSRTVLVNLAGIALAAYELYSGHTITSTTLFGGLAGVNLILRSYGGAPLKLKL